MNLPFDPNNPQAPVQPWDPNRPLFVPQLNIPDNFQNQVPMASTAMANAFIMPAGNNPVRMYMFNKMAANNWINNDFATAVWMLMLTVMMQMSRGRIRYADQNVFMSLADMIATGLGAEEALTTLYQAGVVPPNMVQTFQGPAAQFAQLRRDIQMAASGGQQNTTMGNGWPMTNQQGSVAQPMGGNQWNAMNFNSTPQTTVSKWGNENTGSMMSLSNQQNSNQSFFAPDNKNNDDGFTLSQKETFSSRTYRVPGPVPTTQKSEPENAVIAERPESTDNYTEKDWKSNPLQPFLTYLEPTSTSKRVFIQTPYQGKNVLIEHIEKTQGDLLMDRRQHQIAMLGDTLTLDTGARLENIDNSIQHINKLREACVESEIDAELQDIAIEEYIHDYDLVTADTLGTAIFEAALLWHRYDKDRKNIFVVQADIYNPKVVGCNRTAYLEHLSESIDFISIADQMKEKLEMGNVERAKKDVDPFFYFSDLLNKHLTDAINLFLREILLLEGVSIDSFISDIKDVPGYLRDKYGDPYIKAYLRFEKLYINQLFTNAHESKINKYLETGGFSDEDTQNITFFPTHCTIALVDLFGDEIISPNQQDNPRLIRQSESLWLFNLTQEIAKTSMNTEGSLSHYIVTRDNVIFRINPVLLGDTKDSYTITRLHRES